jgi:F0F1-type ATP synthase membrane subunit b/b'
MACSGSGSESCHELPSARKLQNLQMEMFEIVDSSIRLSRATFQREIARMERELSRISALAPAESGQTRRGKRAVSLTTFQL